MTDADPATATDAGSGPAGGAPVRPAGRFRRGAWAEPDFRRLWLGQTASQLGSQISLVASPLVAISLLHVDAGQMGVLGALARLPFLLYLVAGVFVDRVRRRPVVLGTDLARGLLLLLIPITWAVHVLSFWLLAGITFAVMVLTVWFDIAYMSYVPRLVSRGNLMQANTIMESSQSTTMIVGPGLGGLLVQALTAPFAILADSASYLVSAFAVWRIRAAEPAPAAAEGARLSGIFGAVGAGLRFVVTDRILGPLALAIGWSNLVWAAELALYLLFVARGLGLSAALIGLTLAASGPGALVGSMLAGWAQRRISLSGAIAGGLALFAASALLIPLAPHRLPLAVGVLMLSGFGMALGGQLCAVNVLTTRQLITPDALLGRVNASFRFLALGVSPLGSLLGGFLGQAIGARQALLVAISGMFVPPLIVWFSPVRGLRQMPVETRPPREAGS
ncbi:MAG: MFS transporter [Pseudonocardiales bacterium]|nr:MAG: MFS transporter [Pseudonocardiales bacterium]